MKILIIAYGYAPQVNPRAFRWTALAEHWAAKNSAEIDVVTLWDGHSSAEETRHGVRIHRVGLKFETRLRPTTTAKGASAKPNLLMSSLKWLYRQTWRRVLWPDYACLWYFPALAKARELCALKKYDHIVSVSHPFTGHLVGRALKREFPDCPWMVDIGDPFAFLDGQPPNNLWLYRRFNFWVERRLLARANVISVTTEKTKELYENLLGVAPEKIHCIPPLFHFENLDSTSTPPSDSAIKMTYIGTLYRQIRSPIPLLEAFSQLVLVAPDRPYELHFFGAINDCADIMESYKDKLGARLFIHGLVPRDQARLALVNSSILINLGNETSYQLPSKTVECLASGKPLLNIVQAPTDSSLAFFADHPSVFTLFTNQVGDPGVTEQLAHFIAHASPVDPKWTESRVRRFSLTAVSDAYWRLLQ